MSLINEIPDYLSLAAMSGTVLLTPLYISQRRDVSRLRELHERDPDHARRDLADSEALLDRAEHDLEEVLIATGEFPAVPPTSERPALDQVTMEREALAPHPRWRRFARAAMAPRTLAVVGLLAVVIGIAALVASGKIFGGGNESSRRGAQTAAPAPASVNVAVLNGTADTSLGQRIGAEIKQRGFELGSLADSETQFQQTVVMFSPGFKQDAMKVAQALDVTPIQPIDAQTRSQAPNADVVVIAGVDRAANQP